MHWIDIAIVVAYIAYSIRSGFGSTKVASQNLEEYFLAGRTLKGWQAGISMAATQFAADTPLVVTGLIATAGIFSLWRLWIYAVAFLLMALVLGASWRRAGILTDAQLTEFRYSGRSAAVLRGFKAIYLGFIFNCTVLGMVLLATTRITEPFLVWHEWLPSSVFLPLRHVVESLGFPLTASGAFCSADAMCAVGQCIKSHCIGPGEWAASTDNVLSIGAIILVTTLYSTTGGLRSVVKTDIAQFAIAIGASLVYAVVVVGEAGGWEAVIDRVRDIYPDDRSGPAGMTSGELLAFTPDQAYDVTFAFIGVLMIQWLAQINADGSGYLAQRTMACRSDRDARSAGVIFTVLQVVVRSLIWLPIGLALLVLFPADPTITGTAMAADREATYVRGIAEHLPVGIKGLMITGMLGALASTVDTHLNWGSSYFTNDIYKRFICKHVLKREPSHRGLVWVARLTNFGLIALALGVMPLMDSIQTAWQTSLLLGAGVGALLVVRWLWWRMNAIGELGSLIASFCVALAFVVPTSDPLLSFIDTDALRLLTMASVATTAGILTALLTPPESRETLNAFYRRARPPGFWGPLSDDRAADRRRLAVNLGATFGAGFSMFAVLTGLGSWMVSSPPPAWLPNATAWTALNLIAGLGTAPLWIHLARKGRLPPLPQEEALPDASALSLEEASNTA